MTGSILTIENMTVETWRQGERLLLVDNVSLQLRRGEVVALVGASGAGKSLTCAASLDVLPPGTRRSGGTVTLDGIAQSMAGLRGRHVATILQNPRSAFNPVRTMRAHAMETFKALAIPKPEWEPRIFHAMEAAGLEAPQLVLSQYPFEMSGGMLQRMMIALGLASAAPFLFADEPTSELDLIVQREILDLLDDLRRKLQLGILLVTHDMSVVARLADRVAVIAAGRIVEINSVDEIFRRPAHAYTRQLLDAHMSLYRLETSA